MCSSFVWLPSFFFCVPCSFFLLMCSSFLVPFSFHRVPCTLHIIFSKLNKGGGQRRQRGVAVRSCNPRFTAHCSPLSGFKMTRLRSTTRQLPDSQRPRRLISKGVPRFCLWVSYIVRCVHSTTLGTLAQCSCPCLSGFPRVFTGLHMFSLTGCLGWCRAVLSPSPARISRKWQMFVGTKCTHTASAPSAEDCTASSGSAFRTRVLLKQTKNTHHSCVTRFVMHRAARTNASCDVRSFLYHKRQMLLSHVVGHSRT